jgi:hypothetical protein
MDTLHKIKMAFIALIFSILFFEAFLRYSPFYSGTSPMKYDSKIGMWHKKSYSSYTVKDCYKNQYKFDDNGLPASIYGYNPLKRDVVILGDSFIEAIMVNSKNIIHNALAINHKAEYNFLNYGLSGSSPIQQYVILKDKVDLNNAKYVVQFIRLENDLLDVVKERSDNLSRPKTYIDFLENGKINIIYPRSETTYDYVGDLLGETQMYFFIKNSLRHLRDNLLAQPLVAKHNRADSDQGWRTLKKIISQTQSLIQSSGKNIQYKVIVTSENNENKAIFKEFLDGRDIGFILLNDIAFDMGLSIEGFECDGHWNDLTHKNVASIIKSVNFLE